MTGVGGFIIKVMIGLIALIAALTLIGNQPGF